MPNRGQNENAEFWKVGDKGETAPFSGSSP